VRNKIGARSEGCIVRERAPDNKIRDILATDVVSSAFDLRLERLNPIFPHIGKLTNYLRNSLYVLCGW